MGLRTNMTQRPCVSKKHVPHDWTHPQTRCRDGDIDVCSGVIMQNCKCADEPINVRPLKWKDTEQTLITNQFTHRSSSLSKICGIPRTILFTTDQFVAAVWSLLGYVLVRSAEFFWFSTYALYLCYDMYVPTESSTLVRMTVAYCFVPLGQMCEKFRIQMALCRELQNNSLASCFDRDTSSTMLHLACMAESQFMRK